MFIWLEVSFEDFFSVAMCFGESSTLRKWDGMIKC